jgi:hypothetical protein
MQSGGSHGPASESEKDPAHRTAIEQAEPVPAFELAGGRGNVLGLIALEDVLALRDSPVRIELFRRA